MKGITLGGASFSPVFYQQNQEKQLRCRCLKTQHQEKHNQQIQGNNYCSLLFGSGIPSPVQEGWGESGGGPESCYQNGQGLKVDESQGKGLADNLV